MEILVADENTASGNRLAGLLKKMGHVAVLAQNGADFLDIMTGSLSPRIALLDRKIPEKEGMETIGNVRRIPTEEPPYIILLTGKDSGETLRACFDAGADDFLATDCDEHELQCRIEVAVRMTGIQDTLVKSRDKLAHQAIHDHLTGLLNRRAILDILRKELVRTWSRSEILVTGLCDIDNLKAVNDERGHRCGDEVLCAIARTLRESVREYDSVGRVSGEEFLVIMPMKAGADYFSIFDNLRKKIEDKIIRTAEGNLSVTMSIGLVCVKNGTQVDEIMEISDRALIRAKKEGGNRVLELK